jgi:hypothetical protein
MKDKLNIQHWSKLDWDKLCKIDGFREAVWRALGEKGAVPPPLMEPPEVYALRLLDLLYKSRNFPGVRLADAIEQFGSIWPDGAFGWWAKADKTKQILVCLLALQREEAE